jgi:UDP-2,3-diacylglucosamine pyrophosphatase LpxH
VITDVFISDLHLGHPSCRVTELLTYLQRRRGARLWLVGDVLDHPHIELPPAHQDVLQAIYSSYLDMTWLPGNHCRGAQLARFPDDIPTAEVGVFSAVNGRRYLVTHGDRHDWTLRFTLPRWLTDWARASSPWHGRMIRGGMRRRLLREARSLGYDGVICGHSHIPELSTYGRTTYANCGDWLWSCTAVVADERGGLALDWL